MLVLRGERVECVPSVRAPPTRADLLLERHLVTVGGVSVEVKLDLRAEITTSHP